MGFQNLLFWFRRFGWVVESNAPLTRRTSKAFRRFKSFSLRITVHWCSGNTSDSGSEIGGLNPSWTTFYWGILQWQREQTVNLLASVFVGSSPTTSTILGSLVEWSITAVLKTARRKHLRDSNPLASAQWCYTVLGDNGWRFVVA